MLRFLKKYWVNILVLSVLVLLLFYFLPKEKARYLQSDVELIHEKSDTILLWTVSILSAFLFFWSVKKIKKIKDVVFLILGIGIVGLAFFFFFNQVFLSATFYMNGLSKKDIVYKTYHVAFIDKYKSTLLLWDSHFKKSIIADQLLKSTDQLNINERDSVIVSFNKGILGVNFDPKITFVKAIL